MEKSVKNWARNILSNQLLQHILFWIGTYLALLQHFSVSVELNITDYVFTAWFILPLLLMVYANLWFAFKWYFAKGKYIPYAISLVAIIAVGILSHDLVYDHIVPLALPGFYIISYSNYAELARLYIVVVATATLLKLSKSWFVLEQVRQTQIAAELNALRAQINPHFLFNSLNSIYSLALSRHAKAPIVVLKLSNILRYAVYECSQERVSILRELEVLKDYIALQKLRIDEPDRITFEAQTAISEKLIAPMVILTIVENAFKHAKITKGSGFIAIVIKIEDKFFHLTVHNSYNKDENLLFAKEAEQGVGLSNTRSRLLLLYPKQHELIIQKGTSEFKVKLKLKI